MVLGLPVDSVPLAEVIPYARNPRKNDAAVAKVAASIKEFGFRQPIVVDDQRRFNGHGHNSKKSVPPGAELVGTPGKHRYLMPLDDEMRHRIEPLRKPYPKREKQAMAGPPAQRRCSADLPAPRDATLEGTGETFPVEEANAA
tara:strand:+ start:26 stop:454 length:429 start_codon:yes stop_codon:yes gene_type:complete